MQCGCSVEARLFGSSDVEDYKNGGVQRTKIYFGLTAYVCVCFLTSCVLE